MKIKPDAEYLLMGILMSGSKHGYEIRREIEITVSSTWYVSSSQIYALLKRLESDSFITSTVEDQAARPSKRVYSMTDRGSTAFYEWIHLPTRHIRDFRIEFIAKLHFFHTLSLPGGERLIDEQIKVLKDLQSYIVERGQIEKDPFKTLIIKFKLNIVESLLMWLVEHVQPFFKKRCADYI